MSIPPSPTALVPPELDNDLDECEVLLRRAIEMVRDSTHRSHPTQGLTDRMSGRSRASRQVQIQQDPADLSYVARDAKSGVSVLRHSDRAHLRAMCDRIGWQVIEDAGSKKHD
jgi:hypothetical protein